jgi:hypothetical protein
VPIYLQSFEKVQIWSKKYFCAQIQYRYQNEEFYFDFESVEKILKHFTGKSYEQKCFSFSLLLMFVKFVSLITFLFQQIWNQLEILCFYTHNEFVAKTILGQISTFCKLWSRTCTKALKSLKKGFVNLSWNSIYPSQVLFNFNQICCTLVYNTVHLAEFWTSCIIQYGDTNIHFIHERYLAVGR